MDVGKRVRDHLSSIDISVEDLGISTIFHTKTKLRNGPNIGPKEFLFFFY